MTCLPCSWLTGGAIQDAIRRQSRTGTEATQAAENSHNCRHCCARHIGVTVYGKSYPSSGCDANAKSDERVAGALARETHSNDFTTLDRLSLVTFGFDSQAVI